MSIQCKGITLNNSPCKRKTNCDYCHQHDPSKVTPKKEKNSPKKDSPKSPKNHSKVDKEKLPIVEDIDYFFTIGSKEDNKICNDHREHILSKARKIPEDYFTNKLYGEKWRKVIGSWLQEIQKLEKNYNDYTIEQKGGRKFNYDFEICFLNESKAIFSRKKVEFKYNCESITSLPQFAQFFSTEFTKIIYEEYFYDNYLQKICDKYELSKPSKENYVNNIHKIEPILPFFVELKAKSKNELFRDFVSNIKSESIKKFLSLKNNNFIIEEFNKKILQQNGKYFFFWSTREEQFIIEQISLKKLFIKDMIFIKDHTMCFPIRNSPRDLTITLRWQNTNCVLNPTWQVKLKNR